MSATLHLNAKHQLNYWGLPNSLKNIVLVLLVVDSLKTADSGIVWLFFSLSYYFCTKSIFSRARNNQKKKIQSKFSGNQIFYSKAFINRSDVCRYSFYFYSYLILMKYYPEMDIVDSEIVYVSLLLTVCIFISVYCDKQTGA